MVWVVKRWRYQLLSRNTGTSLAPQTIFFESYMGKSYSCSPKALFEALCADQRFNYWRFVWSFRNPLQQDDELLLGRATLVKRMSPEYLKACAQAEYWISNSRMPEFISPRAGQSFIQCWHGTPLKRLGFDVAEESQAAMNTAAELAERFAIDAAKWSWLLSPSAYTTSCLCSAFGLPEERRGIVIEEGYPRNDSIVKALGDSGAGRANASQASRLMAEGIRQSLGIAPGKRVLLYAPTWRDDSYSSGRGYTFEASLDFAALQAVLGDQWLVLARMHYHVAKGSVSEQWPGFVVDVTAVDDVNQLYLVADALLTDYSSVCFDYANTGRPLLFYWPDFEHYKHGLRGFYFDPAELPGPKCETTAEVIAALQGIDQWRDEYGADYAQFCQRFTAKDDGQASQRVIQRIFG